MEEAFQTTVDYLYEIPKFTTKNSLDHTKKLLELLGNPETAFSVIHVAGSNGKGSVCSFLNQIFLEAGKAVGLFTSPHLVDIRERFQIQGQLCSRESFMHAFEQVKAAADKMEAENFPRPTFFEFIFAMGMVIFADAGVQYVILETGLGGRLDATNAVKEPMLTIITSISLEHTEILGDSIAAIAGEKAGILKPGVSVIYDDTLEEASQVIRTHAEELGCESYGICKKMWKINEFNLNYIDFSLDTKYDNETRWQIPFLSEYQVENAALAITAVRLLPALGISQEQMYAGLKKTRWPGRMEEVLPEVYFDGAHNIAGIREFIKTVTRLCKEDVFAPLLLFSMVKEKDHLSAAAMLTKNIPWEEICVTTIPNQRGVAAQVLYEELCKGAGASIFMNEDYKSAFEEICEMKKPGQKLFCTGSLYFVGALKEYVTEQEQYDYSSNKASRMPEYD